MAGLQTVTFGYTGTPQTFTVPAGVGQIIATVVGGSGGYGFGTPQAAPGATSPFALPGAPGAASVVVAALAVTPGQVLTIWVAGKGGDAYETTSSHFALAVYGGGGGGGFGLHTGGAGGLIVPATSPFEGAYGYGGGGGGGSSAIVVTSTGLVLIEAAGGGGGSAGSIYQSSVPYQQFTTGSGCNGGSSQGQIGGPGQCPQLTQFAGSGATGTADGPGGPALYYANQYLFTELQGAGQPGALGVGGPGGPDAAACAASGQWSQTSGGGGGGGGYRGGGGGGSLIVPLAPPQIAAAGGGGSGSSATDPSTTNAQYSTATTVGAGQVTLLLVAGQNAGMIV